MCIRDRVKKILDLIADEMKSAFTACGYDASYARVVLSNRPDLCEYPVSYTHLKGECQALGGGTYVHHLENGVAFGAAMPETDNKMHGPDEFAVVDELLVSAKIFAQAIVDLCG